MTITVSRHDGRPGLRHSVPAAVVQSSSTGNSQKAEPTETRKRPPAEVAVKAPSATVDPAAPKGVLVLEDQLAEFLKWKDQEAPQEADQKKTADPVCETPAAAVLFLLGSWFLVGAGLSLQQPVAALNSLELDLELLSGRLCQSLL